MKKYILAFTLLFVFAAATPAQAQYPMYNSSTYLHVGNATYYCGSFTNGSADHVMMVSVGLHVVPWHQRSYNTLPETYTRYSNNSVYVRVRHYTFSATYRVDYYCVIRGTDQSWWVETVGQSGPVTRHN